MSGYDVGQEEEARIISWDSRVAKAEPPLPRVSPGDSLPHDDQAPRRVLSMDIP